MAATRAVLDGKSATAHNISVWDATDLVNGLATLIGAELGFGINSYLVGKSTELLCYN
jgi:hypothetical protein